MDGEWWLMGKDGELSFADHWNDIFIRSLFVNALHPLMVLSYWQIILNDDKI